LKFSHEFLQISVSPINVVPLAMSEIRFSRKPISFFPISLGVEPSELVALHLHVAHNEIPRQIVIYNDNYKFAVFLHSILYEFAVNEDCDVMTLHSQRMGSYKVLKRNASITYELDIPWDLGISHTFNGDDSIRFNACLSASIIAYGRSVTEACPTPTAVVQF